jgi:hypothetical protein
MLGHYEYQGRRWTNRLSTRLGSGQYPYLCVISKDVLSAPMLQQVQSGAEHAELDSLCNGVPAQKEMGQVPVVVDPFRVLCSETSCHACCKWSMLHNIQYLSPVVPAHVPDEQ